MQKNPNPLFAEERKRKIMNFIKTNTRCSVSELAELFDITPATIRSDLRELEKTAVSSVHMEELFYVTRLNRKKY